MIRIYELSEVQKDKIFSGIPSAGYWTGTKGFLHKKTLWTIDSAGWLYVSTHNGARLATFADIRKLFKQ